MIFSSSRYAGGKKGQVLDNHSPVVTTYVFRSRIPSSNAPYVNYVWREGDRMDTVALKTIGDETLWWEIADLNPEILNPMHIEPGTVIRVPYGQ